MLNRKTSLNQIILFLWRHKWPGLYLCVAITWSGYDLGKIPIAKEVLWCLSQRTELPAPLQLEVTQVAMLAWKTNQPCDRAEEPLTSWAVAWASQQYGICASWKPWQPEIYFKNKEVLGFWQGIQQLLQGVRCCHPESLIKPGPDSAFALLQSNNSVLTRLQEEAISAGVWR